MPNRCTKNGRFAKHLKKNCFFGTEKFKNRYLEKYKYHIAKKIRVIFLSSITLGKKIPAQSKIGYKFDVESPKFNPLIVKLFLYSLKRNRLLAKIFSFCISHLSFFTVKRFC